MAISDAKKKADAKYHAKKIADGTNKRIGATIKAADYDMIEEYSKAQNMSKAQIIVKAIKYCVDHNISLEGDMNNE